MQHIDKDAFVTETTLLLVNFGDYLHTAEFSLERLKRSGMEQFVRSFGHGRHAKKTLNAHRKRFEKDMARFCRYSALTSLYSIFEVRSRLFIEDFDKTYPGKPKFENFQKNKGFVLRFRHWLETSPNPIVLQQPRLWDLLTDFQSIRNCITHDHGNRSLAKDKDKISATVRRTRKIQFDAHNTLVVDIKFPFEVCERIHAFFRQLFRASGYGIAFPPGYLERMQEGFAGFEEKLTEAIAKHDKMETVNLGGSL